MSLFFSFSTSVLTKRFTRIACVATALGWTLVTAGAIPLRFAVAEEVTRSDVLVQDSFERDEPIAGQEHIGNGWGTNSRTRAKGNQQVDLIDGVMHITRHPDADHGVSVTHETSFQDATIELRFKIGPQDDLGINIADMNEKSVHAGHICMAKITTQAVELIDMKTGRMRLDIRQANQAKSLTAEQKALIASTSKKFKHKLDPSQWHDLQVTIEGDSMHVRIDGDEIGSFQSAGIGHATKSRLRLAVNRFAMIDDVLVTRSK
ncbi:family 16 glycoside hydrolase [Neorhodopirellula pilleata]|uniref:3-keto-alpha-glucoside-1,2-lyase/3-keto-2-hydroxy-glucal hydratase domain-containing protein n=1 Tax=Neorhodopirellula pilleata TaxID=2714738 RepID=A0A5C6AYN2_9BACT|nr:family 16 glycoside hydrolase [Neorhodopirellula pilleata]TWU04096.1 hypothetical protein Pla100_10320 [Neorhodopirellula pilleata]